MSEFPLAVGSYLQLHFTVSPRFSFFFSSRRRHPRCLSDWSSDLCSSDLPKVRRFICSPIPSVSIVSPSGCPSPFVCIAAAPGKNLQTIVVDSLTGGQFDPATIGHRLRAALVISRYSWHGFADDAPKQRPPQLRDSSAGG